MKILINLSDDKIKALNNYQKCEFSNKDGEVAIIIEGGILDVFLEKALDERLPTVVLAGVYPNKENEVSKKCLEHGLLPQSLIYKNEDTLIDYTGETTFKTKVPRGVGINALMEVAEYATKNKLVAEFIVWNPTPLEIGVKNKNKEEVIIQTKEPELVAQKQGKNDVKGIKEEKPFHIAEEKQVVNKESVKETIKPSTQTQIMELNTYIKTFEQVIILFKLSNNADTLTVVNDIQNKYLATLLEIDDNLKMFSRYASNEEKAVLMGDYSYYKDGFIRTSAENKNKVLLIDIELLGDYSELINDLYEEATKKIFVPSNTYDEEELQTLKDWKNNGLIIDAIIVANKNLYDIYVNEIGEVVYYSDEIVF